MKRLPSSKKENFANVNGDLRECWPVKTVCELLGITDRTLFNWEEKGWVPMATIYGPYVYGNRGRYYTASQVRHLKSARDLIAQKKSGDVNATKFKWRLRQKHAKLKGAWDHGCELTFRGDLG